MTKKTVKYLSLFRPVKPPQWDMLDKSIEALKLSTRVENALKTSGFQTIHQVVEKWEIRGIPNIAEKGQKELDEALARIGWMANGQMEIK